DLLDFSKIEAGKLKLVPADFSLRGAVGDTLRALAVRAHKKGLELIYQVQPDVPDALIGDAGRLRQVLLNLAGDPAKVADEGEVVVRVEVVSGGVVSGEWSESATVTTHHSPLTCASQCTTPASASRPTSRSASSGPSSRRTPRPRVSTAARAWA